MPAIEAFARGLRTRVDSFGERLTEDSTSGKGKGRTIPARSHLLQKVGVGDFLLPVDLTCGEG